MKRDDLAIATMSLVRDSNEEELMRKSLFHLSQLNIQIFITDGGSNESFLDYIRRLPNTQLLEPAKGLWPQTCNSLMKAYEHNSKFIFYTEPDKSEFFLHSLAGMIDQIQAKEKTGIVLAARSKSGFQSFPEFQQMTETTINNCCKELIGLETDYVYGPFLINRELIPKLKSLDSSIGWGWRPYAFNFAKRLGFKIEAFTGDFLCPEGQREDSQKERIYRMKQMNQNIEGLILSSSQTL